MWDHMGGIISLLGDIQEGIGLAAAEQAKLIVEQLDFAAEHLDLVSLEELGPQSIEELDDKRANSEVVMVDEVVPLVYVMCSWRDF